MKAVDIEKLFEDARKSRDPEKLRQANKAFDESVSARLNRVDLVGRTCLVLGAIAALGAIVYLFWR